MNVLIACEESQRVCTAFRRKGHNAFSCDIISCSGGHPEWHIMQDVLSLLNGDCEFTTCDDTLHRIVGKWDLIIAHPPCTYLTNTGNPYLNIEKYGNKARLRYKLREESAEFFMKFVNANCDRIAIENPVGYMSTYYRKPNQIIQPWQFGHPFTKATCLWLKGLPNLKADICIKPVDCKSYAWETMYDERGKSISWNCELSKKLRSKTFEGIATAMAEQWGRNLQNEN